MGQLGAGESELLGAGVEGGGDAGSLLAGGGEGVWDGAVGVVLGVTDTVEDGEG